MTNETQLPLAGKVALVTGSGQGIGRATALRLAQAGAAIVVNYRSNDAKANETAQLIQDLGQRCLTIQADVSNEEDVTRLFQQATEALGPITILVNNAGVTRDKLILQMSAADFDYVINGNLRSAFLCTKASLRAMMKARWGCIVNVASVSGLIAPAGQANYAASKAGIIALTMSTAREMASRNVTANAIAPGYVITEMTASLNDLQKKAILDQTPLNRFGSPEDIAATIHFLCSPEAHYITGQVIGVDGGMSIHL